MQRTGILFLVVTFWTYSFGADAPHVDEIDKIAIDHAILAFHAYDKEQGKPQAYDDPRPIGVGKQWHTIPDEILDNWSFYNIMGETGCHQLSILTSSLMGIVGYNPVKNIMTIAYRGSQQLSDWINNMNPGRRILEQASNEFYLHAGYVHVFEHSQDSLHQAIDEALASVSPEDKGNLTVVCTGHSLGGATATIAAFYLADCGRFCNIHLRVFGPPPVGTFAFNDWMVKHLAVAKTFTRESDIFPALSPSCIGLTLTGQQIILPSPEDAFWNHAKAHDNRKYQQAIYEALGMSEDYVRLFDIVFFMNINYNVSL